jgi:uncharacterized protein YqgC (DUF456 family)
MVLALFLLFLGLPGTWTILGIAVLWAFLTNAPNFSWTFFLLLACLAAVGEAMEFIATYFGVKKFGGSGRGSVGGMIGALVGGIMCAPLFFGFGALLGALGGGFVGCWLVEKCSGANSSDAVNAAFGATLGRFGGFVVKLGIGIGMIWLIVPRLWPGITAIT